MWIESLHIDRFGGLRDLTLRFDPGLNIISGQNESGKSTCLSFIHAMLYGMNGKSPSLRQNARKRYMPWNETAMSGSLRLREGKQCYEITRVFGAVKKEDSCRIVDVLTGESLHPEHGQEPGEWLLGIPESVFTDALYVSAQGSRPSGSGMALVDRIRNLIGTGAEDLNSEKALDRLRRARNALSTRTRGGRIDQIQQQITQVQNALLRCEETKQLSRQLENSIAETEAVLSNREKTELQPEKASTAPSPRKPVGLLLTASICIVGGLLLALLLNRWGWALCAAGAALFLFSFLHRETPSAQESAEKCEDTRCNPAGQESYAELREQLISLRVDRETLRRTTEDPTALREQLYALRQEEERLQQKKSALELALHELEETEKARRKDVVPRLTQHMEEFLPILTGGHYTQSVLTDDLTLSLRAENGALRSWEYLSSGAEEQVYLSLRLAMVLLLEETLSSLPVLLDDPFALYDRPRRDNALELLTKTARKTQLLLFTCRGEDLPADAQLIRLNRIKNG